MWQVSTWFQIRTYACYQSGRHSCRCWLGAVVQKVGTRVGCGKCKNQTSWVTSLLKRYISQFIVNNNFRPIFKPVNTRVLSAAAAYDLSRGFTRPIRVFGKYFLSSNLSFRSLTLLLHLPWTEPEVSKYTLNKRKLQYPLFVIAFFFISLLGLVCGEPTDRVYMCSFYGPRYAAIYESLSRRSCGPRSVIKTFVRLPFHFLYRTALFLSTTIYYIYLFMQAVVKAIGWILATAVAAPRRSITIIDSVSAEILNALSFLFLLQWKTWAIAIPACWMLYLEVRQMAIG